MEYGVRDGGRVVDCASLHDAEQYVGTHVIPWNRIVCRRDESSPWVVVFDGEDDDDHPDDGLPRDFRR